MPSGKLPVLPQVGSEVSRNELANRLRNSIISAFQPLEKRDAMGPLFENLMILERLKQLEYTGRNPNRWFWRTHDKKEIDYLEESGGRFRAFEFKWRKGGIRSSVRDRFLKDYPDTDFSIINRENYFEIYE